MSELTPIQRYLELLKASKAKELWNRAAYLESATKVPAAGVTPEMATAGWDDFQTEVAKVIGTGAGTGAVAGLGAVGLKHTLSRDDVKTRLAGALHKSKIGRLMGTYGLKVPGLG